MGGSGNWLSTHQDLEVGLRFDIAAVHVGIGFSVQAIDLLRHREGSDKAWIVWLERNRRSLDEMGEKAARVFIADCDPYGGRGDAGLLESGVGELRMAGQRRAKHDRAGLAQADLQPERRLQAVEQLLEVVSSDPEGILRLGFEVDREKRRRQAKKEMLPGDRGVRIPRNAGAVDIDARMPAQHIGENQGV